jgi:hypothetical protein
MDKVFESWLQRQYADGLALAAASDILTLVPEPGPCPPRRFVAQFKSPTMVREGSAVNRAEGFAVLVQFPPDYLRLAADAAQIVNLLAPANAFHPNVAPPFICIGHVAPGTGLCELIYQVYEILTFQKMTPREDDALNHDACVWARRHMHLFPLSRAPLRRRAVAFSVDAIPQSEVSHASRGN